MSNTSQQKTRKLPEWMTKERREVAAKNVQQASKTDRLVEPHGAASLLLEPEPLKFEHKIIYSFHPDDCALLCDDLLTRLDRDGLTRMGFDMEWPVTYKSGTESKTALIQLSPSLEECYLFHISCMSGLPGTLRYLLQDKRCYKVGVGIEGDIWKLGRDYEFKSLEVIRESMADVGSLANNVLGSKEKWSLDGICQHLFRKRLVKDSRVRKSSWSDYPLSESQKQYAATDAYASLLVYEELKKRVDCPRVT